MVPDRKRSVKVDCDLEGVSVALNEMEGLENVELPRSL